MRKPNFSRMYKIGKAFLTKHSADILTGFTAAGVVVTAIETHKSTLKAEEYLRVNGYSEANDDTKRVLKLEAAKKYALPVVIGTGTIAAAIGANYINHKQIAGLAAACTVAETALSEHRDKIEELLGAKELQKLDDAVNIDKAVDILASPEEPILTGKGTVLCCEGYLTGTKFRANVDWVRKCVNDFNESVNHDTYACYNEFLSMLGLHEVEAGNKLGFNIHQNGLMRISVTSDIDPMTGEPYMIFTQDNPPIANFMEIF